MLYRPSMASFTRTPCILAHVNAPEMVAKHSVHQLFVVLFGLWNVDEVCLTAALSFSWKSPSYFDPFGSLFCELVASIAVVDYLPLRCDGAVAGKAPMHSWSRRQRQYCRRRTILGRRSSTHIAAPPTLRETAQSRTNSIGAEIHARDSRQAPRNLQE